MTGVIEAVAELQFGHRRGTVLWAIARSDAGGRYFIHPSACGGRVPRKDDIVEFDIDADSDPRGPRGVNVRIVSTVGPIENIETLDDLEITCSECFRPFAFSVRDQLFYREHRYVPPKRCPTCRPIVRARLGLQ